MTDNEIVKALQCCFVESNCTECPYYGKPHVKDCLKEVGTKSLDIINRKTEEIEKLLKFIENIKEKYI